MSIATVQFMSRSLWRLATYTALLPEGEAAGLGPYPVLYQLHGGNEGHTAWLHKSKLAQFVRDLPLIIVLPDGPQSRWANGGQPFTHYEDFLMTDLADHVVRTFHATASNWAIGGNSMGGLGAIRLGLKYPERFASVWAHSGVFPTAGSLPEHWHWDGNAEDLDCYALAAQRDPLTLPRLSFDCGASDHLLDSNRRFHAYLEDQHIPHTYREHPGGHDWEYWGTHVRDALEQHIDILKLN
jgi:putative tributyrin esterase